MVSHSQPQLSIIIPTWGDDLTKAFDLISSHQIDERVEWVIAAVETPDQWEKHPSVERSDVTVLSVSCDLLGRGCQMNVAAEKAAGKLLVFNHADTELHREHVESLLSLDSSNTWGGAFHRILDGRHEWLRCFDSFVRFFNERWGILFGDQTVFLSRELYDQLEGFKPYKLMEDVDFSKRLRQAIPITLLLPPLLSSPRRSNRLGSLKVTAINLSLLALFKIGVSPDTLHRIYYRKRE